MNQTAVLQIPISKQLRLGAENGAHEMGFTSLQDAVRLFLTKMSSRSLDFCFQERPVIQLSKKAIKRYDRILDEIEAGKNVSRAESVDDLMRQLTGKS